MKSDYYATLGVSAFTMALLTFAVLWPEAEARGQNSGFSAPGPGLSSGESLPADMENAGEENPNNPYVPPPGVKLRAESVLAAWEATPRRLAQQIIGRYGPPDGITPRALSWHHRGPWDRIVVREDAAPHNFPAQHSDWLEQTVSFRVPAAKFSELAAFDGSLLADRTRGELTARSDSEASNVLALNLAAEIVAGKKTVSEARAELASEAPNRSKGLLFERQSSARDADEAAKDSE